MGATAVVKIEVAGQRLPGDGYGLVAVQIHLLVFHGFPEPFDEDVVAPTALAVHADLNAVLLEHADEGGTGELAALVGVHDFRRAVLGDRFFQRLDARIGCQRIREPPGQNAPGGPVEHGGQIDEPALHRDVGRVHRPDLVRSVDDEAAQAIRVNPVRLIAPAGVGLAVERCDAQCLHQRTDVLAPDVDAVQTKHVVQHAGAGKGMLQMQPVDPSHQSKIDLGCRLRRIVERRA